MAKTETPKGHVCKCGERHRWPFYLFAHIRDRITHTCDKCGERTLLQNLKTVPERELYYAE